MGIHSEIQQALLDCLQKKAIPNVQKLYLLEICYKQRLPWWEEISVPKEMLVMFDTCKQIAQNFRH